MSFLFFPTLLFGLFVYYLNENENESRGDVYNYKLKYLVEWKKQSKIIESERARELGLESEGKED